MKHSNFNAKNKGKENPLKLPKLDFNKLTPAGIKDTGLKYNTTRTPSTEGLDYAFKFHKAKIESKVMDKRKMEEYVFDLENTWTLNTDILQRFIGDLTFSNELKINLQQILERIKVLFNKKKNLIVDKHKLSGKLLMDKQILEEHKRRNEENQAYYQEQMDEFKENIDKKESFLKQFEKKFNEVEIYVQREAKSEPEKWDSFLSFEILAFIYNNEMLQQRKNVVNEELKNIRDDMNEILKENVELKKREEYIDMSEDYDNQKSKYNSLIKLYKSKIKFLERNNEHLKSCIKGLSFKLDNITSNNNNLNTKITIGTKSDLPVHKKLNSVSSIKFNELKLKELNAKKNLIETQDVTEQAKDTIQEINEDNNELDSDGSKNSSDQDIHNKSHIDIFKKSKKDHSELIDEPSLLNKNPEFNLKDNWDISCIENFIEN